MKKIYVFLFIILIALGIGFGFYFYKSNNKKISNNSYNSTKMSSIDNSSENQNSSSSNTQNSSIENETAKKDPIETQIADFTTKIYTKESDRQNNISITCSTLNDKIVNNGDTFSFCETVGKSTSSKGYEKADVFKDGEVIQAMGGGNCQVSSTLYNAVLKVPELDVTERHEHSNSVPYVEKGKDAAVAYGSYDFKFVNNTGNKIKISASCDKNFVYIKLFKIE